MSDPQSDTRLVFPDDTPVSVVVEVTGGPARGEQRELVPGESILVGRGKDTDLRIKGDKHISRQHFRLKHMTTHCIAVDMGSQNGTRCDDNLIDGELSLKDGNTLTAGSSQFCVWIRPNPDVNISPDVEVDELQLTCDQCGRQIVSAKATMAVSNDEKPAAKAVLFQNLCRNCRDQNDYNSEPVFPGYHTVDLLGEGSMGAIYLVERDSDEKLLALKILRPGVTPKSTDIARFLREAALLQQLNHPNIVRYADQGYIDGEFFFLMEYVEGVDLDLYRRQAGGRVSVERCVQIISQVLSGLDFAHRKGFVHRDVKPANILIGVDNGVITPKLTDFGLAKSYHGVATDPVTRGHISFGTPDYMPPEQITRFKDADPRGDIYALAASIYHLVTGETLFAGLKGRDPIRTLLESRPPPIESRNPALPSAFAAVVNKALSFEPRDRWATAAAFRNALENAIDV